jgi:CDP-diacylglycerol--glycerol-3-phosphate 3-phosphatidyltransferase
MKKFITFLTISRIVLAPLIFILIVSFKSYGLALLLFLASSVTDYLDGYFARKFNATSILGEILDPISDKITIIFVLLALIIELNSVFIAFISAVMISRDIWVNGMRELNARLSHSDRTKVTFMAKIKTAIQMSTVSLYLFALFINNAFLLFISNFLLFAALIVSLVTGLRYTVNSLEFNGKEET